MNGLCCIYIILVYLYIYIYILGVGMYIGYVHTSDLERSTPHHVQIREQLLKLLRVNCLQVHYFSYCRLLSRFPTQHETLPIY